MLNSLLKSLPLILFLMIQSYSSSATSNSFTQFVISSKVLFLLFLTFKVRRHSFLFPSSNSVILFYLCLWAFNLFLLLEAGTPSTCAEEPRPLSILQLSLNCFNLGIFQSFLIYLNWKIFKHLKSSNLISHWQCGKFFDVVLGTSKAFERTWHKA